MLHELLHLNLYKLDAQFLSDGFGIRIAGDEPVGRFSNDAQTAAVQLQDCRLYIA